MATPLNAGSAAMLHLKVDLHIKATFLLCTNIDMLLDARNRYGMIELLHLSLGERLGSLAYQHDVLLDTEACSASHSLISMVTMFLHNTIPYRSDQSGFFRTCIFYVLQVMTWTI